MNINSNEILLLRNNGMRFGQLKEQPVPEAGQTATNPQDGMKALELQAQNNIAFQGVSSKMAKTGLKLLAALTLFGGVAASATSCTDGETNIYEIPGESVEVNVTVDMSQMLELQQQYLALLQQLLEQNKITSEMMENYGKMFAEFMEMYKQGQLDANEFYAKMFEFMTQNDVNQQTIIELLQKGGMTPGESEELLAQLLAEVKAGNLSAAEAWKQIMDLLGDINSKLDGIMEKLGTISSDLNNFFLEYQNSKNTIIDLLKDIKTNGETTNNYLEENNTYLKEMNENITNIEKNVDVLINITSSETDYSDLLEALKSLQLGSIDYEKFEQMFNNLGLKLSDVIKMSATELKAYLENFKDVYVNNEKAQLDMLNKIYAKLSSGTGDGSIDTSTMVEILNKIYEALTSADNESIKAQLEAIEKQLEIIAGKLGEILDSIGTLTNTVTENFNKYDGYWQQALEKLNTFETDMNTIIENQNQSNEYLQKLEASLTELKLKIENFIEEGNSGDGSGKGMTLEEFKNYMDTRDAQLWAKLEALADKFDLSDLLAKFDGIEALLQSMDDKLNNLKDYSSQMDQIIDLLGQLKTKLDSMDKESPDYTDLLNQIKELLENFECNCNCGGAEAGKGNEGVLGQLEALL